MSQAAAEGMCWTIRDIDLLPDNQGTRDEIVDVARF